MMLPTYRPPTLLRACLALAVAPLLVLLAFALLQWGAVDADVTLAVLVACIVWVAAEVQGHQNALDAYDSDFEHHHLAWRAPATLAVLAQLPSTDARTRDFVRQYVQRLQARPGAVPVAPAGMRASPLPPALG